MREFLVNLEDEAVQENLRRTVAAICSDRTTTSFPAAVECSLSFETARAPNGIRTLSACWLEHSRGDLREKVEVLCVVVPQCFDGFLVNHLWFTVFAGAVAEALARSLVERYVVAFTRALEGD